MAIGDAHVIRLSRSRLPGQRCDIRVLYSNVLPITPLVLEDDDANAAPAAADSYELMSLQRWK